MFGLNSRGQWWVGCAWEFASHLIELADLVGLVRMEFHGTLEDVLSFLVLFLLASSNRFYRDIETNVWNLYL